jgi:hypothetical protein
VVDFARMAAVAQRLIEANGRTVTIVKHGKNPQDTDQPWRGSSEYPVATVTGSAAFVAASDLGHRVRDDQNVKRADKVALFAAVNDGGHALEEFDVIEDGESVWHIVGAQVLQPGSTRLLYLFEVQR